MIKLLKDKIIFILFLIPLFPHLSLNIESIHLDDIPIILYIFLVFLSSKKLFEVDNVKNFYPMLIFVFYIFIQNVFIYNDSLNTEIFRYSFYLILFLHLQSINKNKVLYHKLPIYLFYFLASFAITSYFFNLNLGTDSYNYWNIGLNNNEWGFTPGRVNGFQAGGPNSFGDLICVLGIYTLANVKEQMKPLIVFLSFVSCFFTYSRSSLIVLTLFMIVYLIQKSDLKNLSVLILAILFTLNFGLIERFTSEKETEGIQDRIEMQTATSGYLTNQNLTSLFVGNGLNNVGVVNDKVGSVNSFDENLRVTGPHNSYLFFILKYGIIGLIMYLLIFNKYIKKILNINLKKLFINGSFLSVSAFLTLGLTSDLLHNHTVVWLIFYFLYDLNE